MSKNPIINAVSASLYITLIATIMNFVSHALKNKPDTFFAPVAFLSLLTLSVSVMAYLFFYQPVQLFLKGNKKEALKLFVQTVLAFGVITSIVATLVFTGVI